MGRTPRELVAQAIDDRHRQQQGAKEGDLDGARLPDAHPGRIGLGHGGAAALQHLSGQPVLGLEDREAAVPGGAVHAVAQEGQLPGVGRREALGADHEDRRLGVARRPLGFQPVEVERVQVPEGEGIGALLDLDAVVDATAHEARALEGFDAGTAHHEQRLFAVFQARAQRGEARLAEQALAHVGVVEVTEPQLDEGLGAALQAQLLGHHAQALHRAHLHQLVPAVGPAAGHETRGVAAGGFDDADLAGHRRARELHHLVLRDHRDGGAGDGVQAQDVLVRTRRTDLDLVGDRLAEVLVVEVDQRGLRNAQQQDGLGVLEHLHADVAAAHVHADQRDHRLARVGRGVGDVGREHHVAQQGLLARLLRVGVAIGLHIRGLAHALGKTFGAREHVAAGHEGTQVGVGGQVGGQMGLVGLCLCVVAERAQQQSGGSERGRKKACNRHG